MQGSVILTERQFNALMAKLDELAQLVKPQVSDWVTPAVAMELIGCKATKLKELRLSGELHWRYAGNGKGVRISRKSIESYIAK
jgi:hypothetical protein